MSISLSMRLPPRPLRMFSLPRQGQLIAGGVTVVAISGLAFSQRSKLFKMAEAFPSLKWQHLRLLPDFRTFSSKEIVLSGMAFVAGALILYALHVSMKPLPNSSFPKSFMVRMRQDSDHCAVSLVGAGVVLGTRYLISAFKIDIPSNPPRLLVAKSKTERAPVTGWAALPPDILGQIFPLALDQSVNGLQSFWNLFVCTTWKEALLHKDCLLSLRYERHFLWVPFYRERFMVMEIVAFFNRFLPQRHTGEGLRLPTGVLGSSVQNYITPAQLAYIVKRFPDVEIEALTLCLADEDNAKETGKLLSHFLEKGKIHQLTIACERLRDPHHNEQLGKMLTRSERRARPHDWITDWKNSSFHNFFSSQVIKLIKHLKGQIPILVFQLLPENPTHIEK